MARGGGGGGAKGLASKIGTGTVLTVLSALSLPIWLGALAAWALMVASLASLEKQSNQSHFLMFDWFVISLDIVVLMLIPFHLLVRRSSPGICALLAVVTVLKILRCNVWNNVRLGGGAIQIDSVVNPGAPFSKVRTQCLFAGYLIASFFELLLLIAFGNLPANSAQDIEHIEHKTRKTVDEHKSSTNGSVPDYDNGPRVDVENQRQPTITQVAPNHTTPAVVPKPNFDDYPRTHHDTPTNQADGFNPVPRPPANSSGQTRY